MTVWQRIQRVFVANTHATVDQLEHPEAMLNQVQRELIDAIVKIKGATRQGQRWCEQMDEEIERLIGEIAHLQHTAEEAVADSQESLARRAIERKLRKQQLLAQKKRQLERARAQLSRQEQRLDQLKYELSDLKAKSRELIQRQRFADVFATAGGQATQAEPVSIVVDRMQEKVEMAEAACEVSLDFEEQDPLDAELAQREVEQELARLQEQVAKDKQEVSRDE